MIWLRKIFPASLSKAEMALAGLRNGASLWCPQQCSRHHLRSSLQPSIPTTFSRMHRYAHVTSAAHGDLSKEYVIVGGGNAAGYAAQAFTENGVEAGKLCIISSEKVPPYERPTLTKAYLFPIDKNPPRLPGFHTCVGTGGARQADAWYKEKGIEVLYGVSVTGLDVKSRTLSTSSNTSVEYGNLIIATGSTATRLPESLGGRLPGVHYIRDVADADALVAAFQNSRKLVVIGGGYIGMEVAAAATGWQLDTTMVFPEDYLMPKLFTPSIAEKYEDLYQQRGVNFIKGVKVNKIISGESGRVSAVEISNGTSIEADLVVVGIGARPAIGPFADSGLDMVEGGIAVDGQFRTSSPQIRAIGDVAAFPLQIYDRITRVEHVDHARKSARHCVEALLQVRTDLYDYLPFFYSRVFEYPGSLRKVWWQFYGDNVGEVVEVGNFDPKYAAFWIQSGKLKGVFLESGTPEEFASLPKLARQQPSVSQKELQEASSVEDALKFVVGLIGETVKA